MYADKSNLDLVKSYWFPHTMGHLFNVDLFNRRKCRTFISQLCRLVVPSQYCT